MKPWMLLVAALAVSLSIAAPPDGDPTAAVDLKLTDVKTKFAANMCMWFRGDHIERMKQAKALGFTGVEFWGLNETKVEEIAKASQELGLEVVQFTGGGGGSLGDARHHAAFVKGVERSCRWARKMNCKKFTVVQHRWVDGIDEATQVENYTKAMLLAKPILEKHGVMLIIEPFNPVDHGKNLLNGSQRAVEICRAVDSPMVKINWDFYHMQLSEGALCTYLKRGFDQVGYIQLGDTPGRNQPGTGELNYSFILKYLYELGYRGYVGIECRAKGSPEAALQQLLRNAY